MKTARTTILKKVSWIAISGNGILAVLTIVIGVIAGSLAVIGAGIDTATDIVTSIITLFAAVIISKPPDREHPYGHMRAETVATKLVSFIIFFAGAQLALKAGGTLLEGTTRTMPEIAAIYVTILSIIGKILLAYMLLSMGKRHDSSMLAANGKNMLTDILSSSSILIGLACTFLFKLPILDPIVALLVSVWVMKTAVSIFIVSMSETMDSVRDHSVYDEVFAAVDDVKGASNPHRARIRKIGTHYDIDLDIEVDGAIPVEQGHQVALSVEKKIKEHISNVYDVMVHVEPLGNIEKNEAYGRSPEGDSGGGGS